VTPDNDSAPALTEDELIMYFTRGDNLNVNRDVYVTTRTSRSALFQNPVNLTAGDISSSHEEIVGAVSPDGCTLTHAHDGAPPHAHPFVATKPASARASVPSRDLGYDGGCSSRHCCRRQIPDRSRARPRRHGRRGRRDAI
jgi:hypothetical protein